MASFEDYDMIVDWYFQHSDDLDAKDQLIAEMAFVEYAEKLKPLFLKYASRPNSGQTFIMKL